MTTATEAARACERVRLEFGHVIETLSGLARDNPTVAADIYWHIEEALEARVFRLVQQAERNGFEQGRLAERRAMIRSAGAELRRGREHPTTRLPGERKPSRLLGDAAR